MLLYSAGLSPLSLFVDLQIIKEEDGTLAIIDHLPKVNLLNNDAYIYPPNLETANLDFIVSGTSIEELAKNFGIEDWFFYIFVFAEHLISNLITLI